ncbi:hypothetical protein L218DRAFT_731296 [Marasmius fiardii PR-910]|nr:hypothetical protein L218DRAFT_731296 [Marasmius fiardii PR-910]
MILIPGVAAFRRGGMSELMRTVYQDGVVYYALMCLCSVINVIVILRLSPDLVHLLSSFERTLHSILTSHAILHIRQVHSQYATLRTISQIQFAESGSGPGDPVFLSRGLLEPENSQSI